MREFHSQACLLLLQPSSTTYLQSFTHFSFPTFTLQGPRGRDLHLESSQSSLLVKGLRPNIVKGWDCWGKRRTFKHLKIGTLTKVSFQLCRLEFGHSNFLKLLTFRKKRRIEEQWHNSPVVLRLLLNCNAFYRKTFHYDAFQCTSLHSMTSHCIAFITLHCFSWNCIELHYITLHSPCCSVALFALHCIILDGIALHWMAFHCIGWHCIGWHCIALHLMALHWMAWHCIALDGIALDGMAWRCIGWQGIALRWMAWLPLCHWRPPQSLLTDGPPTHRLSGSNNFSNWDKK